MLDKAKRYFQKIQIKNKQRAIDKQYAREGLSNDVLEKQIEINCLRHELDIPDESKFIFEDFVQ